MASSGAGPINPTPPKRQFQKCLGPRRHSPEARGDVSRRRGDTPEQTVQLATTAWSRRAPSRHTSCIYPVRGTHQRTEYGTRLVFKVGPVAECRSHRTRSRHRSKNASTQPYELYLSYVPPTYEYGTRPFLRWVLSQGRSPTREAVPKMPRTPSAFPFSGRLRRRAINPTPPKRVKAWGDGPLRPEVMYPVVEHTRTDCAARNHSRSRVPHHRTQSSIVQKNEPKELYLSYVPPTYEYGTRPFLRWVLSQGRSPTREAVPKMPRTPSAFPFSGRLRRRAINPTPPKRVKAWGDGPLRPEVMYPAVGHTRTDCAARNHSRSRVPHHRTQSSIVRKKRAKGAVFILRPTNVRIWHMAVFKVGPVAGPKPNTRGSSKNASSSIRAVFILRPTNVRIWHKAVF